MKKWVFLGVVLVAVFGVLYYITFGYFSEGERGGFVVKLSKRGYVFKTYEGVLNVGGIADGSGSLASAAWEFSIDQDNQQSIININEAIKNGRRVTLHYQEKFFSMPWNGDTKYFVTNVELANPPVYQMGSQPMMQLPATPAPVKVDSTKK